VSEMFLGQRLQIWQRCVILRLNPTCEVYGVRFITFFSLIPLVLFCIIVYMVYVLYASF
jgi:hypothetical protein